MLKNQDPSQMLSQMLLKLSVINLRIKQIRHWMKTQKLRTVLIKQSKPSLPFLSLPIKFPSKKTKVIKLKQLQKQSPR
jgi:hypothetical protein